MNNKFFLFTVSTLFVILLLIDLVPAQNIEIVAPEKTVILYTGKSSSLEILVKNNQRQKDTFYFSVWPTYWVSLDKYWMALRPDEVGNISLVLEPPIDAEEGMVVYTLTVRSVDYNISSSKEINFKIVRSTSVFLSEVKINKQIFRPGETVTIQPVITNLHRKDSAEVFITTKILKDNSIIKKFEDSLFISPGSMETLSNSFELDITKIAGEYEVDVVLKNELNKVLDEKTINFDIETIHKIDEEKSTTNSLLYSTVIIKITNNGNVVESNFYVTESLPLISKNFFFPEIEPIQQEEKDNRIVYTWSIKKLAPTENIIITYQLRFTNLVLVSCLLIIIVVWIVWLFYRPKLRKGYMGLLAGGKELTISLNLKNRQRKTIENIIVKDFVPPLAAVVKRFDTLVPTLKRTESGTELAWKIKELRPKEERVLTYKIKPSVDILGKLKLPKAHLVYKTKKGKKRRVLSKTVSIMGKVK